MPMVRFDTACSGVMFTPDTGSGLRDLGFLTGSRGRGENAVDGKADPDGFRVHEPTFRARHRAARRRAPGRTQRTMVLAGGPIGATSRDIPTPPGLQARCRLTAAEPLTAIARPAEGGRT
jgi:pyruvate,water dikinase